VRDQGQQGPDLPPTQHDRQLLKGPGAHEVDARPGALQRARGAEPTPVEVNAEGGLGALLLMAPAEELLAHLLVAELGRRASVVVRQLADRVERALWGLGGQAP
jgi:hypothetical protein